MNMDTAMNTAPDKAGTRVIVGMSGGVDSSVAACLLIQAGYQVEGLFMKNWDEDDGSEFCTAAEDLIDATAVCEKLGIRLHTANFAAEYWENVFEHFLDEYSRGRTPNPDILCNREIKFKVFVEYAGLLGADLIATGHYAKLVTIDGEVRLCKALDHNKDQSYFLQSVPQEQLAKTLFPLGDLHKPQVRKLAQENNLPTHNKKDSTGICFIGERRFRDFLKTYLPAKKGDIVTLSGDVIGEHEGLMYHTLGQRQGLRIGGVRDAGEAPWYVVAKDMEQNQLKVAQGNQHPALFCDAMYVKEITWIGSPPALPAILNVKTRYRQPDQSCEVRHTGDGFYVRFIKPQRAVTPGQWACFYRDEICLGGGIIEQTFKSATEDQVELSSLRQSHRA